MRLQRRIRVAPGVRVNLGLTGISTSFGPPGASITAGTRGISSNLGLPGTGLYHRQNLGSSSGNKRKHSPGEAASVGAASGVKVGVKSNGTVSITHEDESPINDDAFVRRFKRERRGEIMEWLRRQCEEADKEIAIICEIHAQTPPPDRQPAYTPKRFTEESPNMPILKAPGFWARIFPAVRQKLEARNRVIAQNWAQNHQAWEERKRKCERADASQIKLYTESRLGGTAGISAFLEYWLPTLHWPRETLIEFDVSQDGTTVNMDVDLPEIEDLPENHPRMSSGQMRVVMNKFTDKRKRHNYARHIHGVLFRIIGECFASFPQVAIVVASGYSQRPDHSIGAVNDDYLLSVRVMRSVWSEINFDDLGMVDPVPALERLELRRDMTKTGIMRAIRPFTPIGVV